MSSTRNPGRVAGFLYLLLVLAGPLRLIYIPNKLFVHGNAAATASKILASETLFRLGLAGEMLTCACDVALIAAMCAPATQP
jgi:hypothetical protein